MHFVMGDIHNEVKKLKSILKQINLGANDELIVLGDIFDRGGASPDPVEVYFTLSGIQDRCTWIRGNHDQWLADYIDEYYSKSERSVLILKIPCAVIGAEIPVTVCDVDFFLKCM